MFGKSAIRVVILLILPAFFFSALATPVQESTIKELRAKLRERGIENIHELQARGFAWFEVDGRKMLVSDNGRYAVTDFELMDMWNMKPIRTVDDLVASRRVDFDRIGLKVSDLDPLKFGHGEKSMTVFFDPTTNRSRQLLGVLRSYVDSFTFDLVMVSSRGAKSEGHIVKLACLPDNTDAITAISAGAIQQLPKPDKSCQPLGITRAMVTAKMIGVRRLPYILSDKGEFYEGIDAGLNSFLASKQ